MGPDRRRARGAGGEDRRLKLADDKSEVRAAILRAAVEAHPGTLERQDLDVEPAIARASGQLVHAQLRSLTAAGLILCVDTDPINGTVHRLRATGIAAEAVKAVLVG